MKFVHLITLHRRYLELSELLARIGACRDVFPETPPVYVVWADPEIGRLWYIKELLESGAIDKVITRPKLPTEGVSLNTTYFESRNVRLALNQIKKDFGEAYVIGHSTDVMPHRDTYGFIVNKIKEGNEAVLFHWENNCARQDVWHTNFFCIPLDKEYWPPISPANEQDVLERQWGKSLKVSQPPSIFRTHNYQQKRFSANHRTEGSEPWPIIPQVHSRSLNLLVFGYKPWWSYIIEVYQKLKNWCIPN